MAGKNKKRLYIYVYVMSAEGLRARFDSRRYPIVRNQISAVSLSNWNVMRFRLNEESCFNLLIYPPLINTSFVKNLDR